MTLGYSMWPSYYEGSSLKDSFLWKQNYKERKAKHLVLKQKIELKTLL